MLKSSPASAPVPVGILVPAVAPPDPERPPIQHKPSKPSDTPFPWLLLVTGGSVVCSALLVAVGFCVDRPAEMPPATELVSLSQPIELPEPVPQPPPASAPQEPVPDMELPPLEAPVKLPKRELPILSVKNEMPALIPEERIEPAVPPKSIESITPRVEKPQVPVKPTPVWNKVDTSIYASCEQIGTNILFVKNYPDAFKQARKEKKLVFVVHLSGNLEDKDFT